MQLSSFAYDISRRFSIMVRQIRAVSGSLRKIRRSGDRVVTNADCPRRTVLSNGMDYVDGRRLQASALFSIAEDNKRQLESGADYPNSPVLSSTPSIPGESRGSGRSESSLQEENIRPNQGGIISVAFFLHLGIRPEGSDAPDRSAIETVLNKAKDWYRYAPNCWIIYTSQDADEWYDRLKAVPGIKNHASFFLCEVKLTNRSGWMPEKFWEWVGKDRS